jgi:hypothetical protein
MSKCTYSRQAYRVKDSEPAIVGVLMIEVDESCTRYITYDNGAERVPAWNQMVLMMHSPARLPIFVPFGDLVPWGPPGGDEMPQPEKTK